MSQKKTGLTKDCVMLKVMDLQDDCFKLLKASLHQQLNSFIGSVIYFPVNEINNKTEVFTIFKSYFLVFQSSLHFI